MSSRLEKAGSRFKPVNARRPRPAGGTSSSAASPTPPPERVAGRGISSSLSNNVSDLRSSSKLSAAAHTPTASSVPPAADAQAVAPSDHGAGKAVALQPGLAVTEPAAPSSIDKGKSKAVDEASPAAEQSAPTPGPISAGQIVPGASIAEPRRSRGMSVASNASAATSTFSGRRNNMTPARNVPSRMSAPLSEAQLSLRGIAGEGGGGGGQSPAPLRAGGSRVADAQSSKSMGSLRPPGAPGPSSRASSRTPGPPASTRQGSVFSSVGRAPSAAPSTASAMPPPPLPHSVPAPIQDEPEGARSATGRRKSISSEVERQAQPRVRAGKGNADKSGTAQKLSSLLNKRIPEIPAPPSEAHEESEVEAEMHVAETSAAGGAGSIPVPKWTRPAPPSSSEIPSQKRPAPDFGDAEPDSSDEEPTAPIASSSRQNSVGAKKALKHPPSAYQFYVKQKRPEVQEEHPESMSKEITKILADRWKQESAEIKEPFKAEAAAARDAWLKEQAERKANGDDAAGVAEESGEALVDSSAKSKGGMKAKTSKPRAKSKTPKARSKGPEGAAAATSTAAAAETDLRAAVATITSAAASVGGFDAASQMRSEAQSQSREKIAVTRTQRRKKQPHRPKRPLTAYLLFVRTTASRRHKETPDIPMTEITTQIAKEWSSMDSEARQPYEDMASKLSRKYNEEVEKWKGDFPEEVNGEHLDGLSEEEAREIEELEAKIPHFRAKNPDDDLDNISDEEKEYETRLSKPGASLEEDRPTGSEKLADFTRLTYRKGRASQKTFKLARVYRSIRKPKKYKMPQDEDATPQSGERGSAARLERNDGLSEEEEEVVGSVDGYDNRSGRSGNESSEEEEQSDEDDGRSAAPSDLLRFRRSRNTLQMRMQDGRLVLDESTMEVDRHALEEDGVEREVFEERDDQTFTNSATRSKRKASGKWSDEETVYFLKAVSQWGTDFEMIARLFPGRDRRQIKQKWRREELRNPGLLDEAFEKRQFVSAVDYAKEMADRTKVEVDLSGPTPLITPRPPPALDGVAGQQSDEETAGRSKRAASEAQSGSEWEQSDAEGRNKRRRRGSDASASDASGRQRSSSVGSARSRSARQSRERERGRDHAHRADVMAQHRAELANEPEEEVIGTLDDYNN